MDPRDTRDRIGTWVTNHFSITNSEADVPSLLRSVANTLEAIGPLDVHDITFAYDGRPEGETVTMTVYLTFVEPELGG